MANKEKKCPFKFAGRLGGPNNTFHCEQNDCEWWDEKRKRCCMLTIAIRLKTKDIPQ